MQKSKSFYLVLRNVASMLIILSLIFACSPSPTPESMATRVPPTATPVPPTDTPEPTSCEEVEGVCLDLTFDGESCTYTGPMEFKTGPITLLFFNESELPEEFDSEGMAAAGLLKHRGNKIIQDMIDYIGVEPSTETRPWWSEEIYGVYKYIYAGDSYTWEGNLEPGIYTMVCVKGNPFGVWFGTGLTVEN